MRKGGLVLISCLGVGRRGHDALLRNPYTGTAK